MSASTADAPPPGRLAACIFVKAPRPGRCKTRLARGIGTYLAAARYRAMASETVAAVRAASRGPILLCCAPDTRHPFLQRLARRHGCRLVRQARGSLGDRMHVALTAALAEAPRAVVIGTDQPDWRGHPLAAADHALAGHADAWLAPTHDGGYWMLGLTRPNAAVFRGIAWSTPRVATQTRTALRRQGLAWAEAAPRRDIDEARDWAALPDGLRRRLARAAIMPGAARR